MKKNDKKETPVKQKLSKLINDASESIKDFKTKVRVQSIADDLKYKKISMSQDEIAEIEVQIKKYLSRLSESNALITAAIYDEEKKLHQQNFDNTVKLLATIVESIK